MITEAEIDRIRDELVLAGSEGRTCGKRPVFVLVMSRRAAERLKNEEIRMPRRLARRKARGGKA